jgi:hypothetical protein
LWRAPLQLEHTGSGSFAGPRTTFSTAPRSSPFSMRTRTMARSSPLWSSIVAQRPSGDPPAAAARRAAASAGA